jgi:membrane protein
MLRPADRGALSPRHRTDPRSAGGRVRSDVGLLMAFWAFFSIFPLRFIFVTLLGYVLPPSLQGDVLRSAARFFPLLSTDSIGRLSGQWWTLLIGILNALWSGS